MPRRLYTLLFSLLLPLVLLRLGYRALRAPAYARRIGERFGRFAGAPAPGGIWVHAVSVGEVVAAVPLVRQLLARHPGLAVTVTTMTPTGSERVQAMLGPRVFHVHAPYDLPGCWRRFLRRIQPRLLVVMETELWPNCIHACHRRGVPVLLANARLSARSARGYGRVAPLTRQMLGQVNRVAAQTREHGQRLVALGLPAERLQITGSIKFDLELSAELRRRAAALRCCWDGQGRWPIWVAASTHEGEEAALLEAHRRLRERHPEALLVLVPRHPERFDRVADLIASMGLSRVRRSSGAAVGEAAVLLGDTMGELLALLGGADMAFVGGSLIERGGHNTLEPAAWALPVLTGPSDYNFPEVSRLLQQAGALQVVADGDELTKALGRLADDPELRRRRGQAAAAAMAANRGALERVLEMVDGALAETGPPADQDW